MAATMRENEVLDACRELQTWIRTFENVSCEPTVVAKITDYGEQISISEINVYDSDEGWDGETHDTLVAHCKAEYLTQVQQLAVFLDPANSKPD